MLKTTMVLLAVTALGCAHRDSARDDRSRFMLSGIAPPNEAVAIGGGPRAVAVEIATDDIAEARCAREARCGHIGAGERFFSRRECLETIAKEVVDELDTTHCPDGINASSLDTCLSDTKGESCASTADHCRAAKVCVRDSDTAAE